MAASLCKPVQYGELQALLERWLGARGGGALGAWSLGAVAAAAYPLEDPLDDPLRFCYDVPGHVPTIPPGGICGSTAVVKRRAVW